MANLNNTDQFIVNREGNTYKATFEDIQASLDLAYTANVDETGGGTITSYTIYPKGKYFLVGDIVEFSNGINNVSIIVTDIGPNGEIEASELNGNSSGLSDGLGLQANPFSRVGEIKEISNAAAPTDYLDNTTAEFVIHQDPWLEPNPDYTDDPTSDNFDPDAPAFFERYPTGGVARVIGQGVGNEPLIELISRGDYYRNSDDGDDGNAIDTYLERSISDAPDNNYKINLTAVDITDIESISNDAILKVDSVADGSATDKILLTVQIGSDDTTAQTVALVPGRGIQFKNTVEENEVEIFSTIDSGGNIGGGGGGSTSAFVIISPNAPQEPTYELTNGSLWFNTEDGRLYVAITFPTDVGYGLEWIDASPSSFNDALRKNQDDKTDYKIDVNNSLYATHFDLERLPLIGDAPTP